MHQNSKTHKWYNKYDRKQDKFYRFLNKQLSVKCCELKRTQETMFSYRFITLQKFRLFFLRLYLKKSTGNNMRESLKQIPLLYRIQIFPCSYAL